MYDMKVAAVKQIALVSLALVTLAACGGAPVSEDPTASPQLVDSPPTTALCGRSEAELFETSSITGAELASTSWMDQQQVHFYTFASGSSFEARTEPACTRGAERCEISVDAKRGTFTIAGDGDAIELHYETGEVTAFFATRSCAGAWKLTGQDFGSDLTLVASTIPQ
jgi:hypothetical protein